MNFEKEEREMLAGNCGGKVERESLKRNRGRGEKGMVSRERETRGLL